jgi:hypothetical protein
MPHPYELDEVESRMNRRFVRNWLYDNPYWRGVANLGWNPMLVVSVCIVEACDSEIEAHWRK